MIEFQLETSGVATCLQLVQQVHQALRMGMLEPGDRLPTAQQVVAQLAINPNTVHKAYRELERDGLVRARVGFVAQDTPVYARMTVADHLRFGAWLNPGWDDGLARRRIGELGLDPKQRGGSLSGGQRAQLALTLALAKRPELLLLDEPVASLDPLARREFLRGLMEAVAEGGQPASRYWPFQWAETALYLAAALALAATSFRRLRRRLT